VSKLGKKWTCYSCGVKFYDFSKPDALCPKCGSSQKSAPAKARAAKKGRSAIQIDDDYTGEHEHEQAEESLEESFGISQARVEGVDPGDLKMDDFDD
jgi:hypothetical protein